MLFIMLHLLARDVQGQTSNMGFNRFSLATDPKIVSAKATLSYLMELTTGLFQTDDYITFSLPSGYFEESTELSACTSNTEGITVTSCVTTKN